MTIEDDGFQRFFIKVLEKDQSIRFIGIANHLGSLIATAYRQSLIPLMTNEETLQYSIQSVLRATTREDFESKIGKLEYSIGKYEKLIRATIPILLFRGNEDKDKRFYLLLSFDVNSDAKYIIENKILPLIKSREHII
jgi:hypothetical protein